VIDFKRLNQQFPIIQAQYRAGQPFPHVVIDGLFHGDELANALEDWPRPDNDGWKTYQRGKRAFSQPGLALPWAAMLMRSANQRKFVDWLAALTGISDLSPDHDLGGGGLHELGPGGQLGIHVDFNRSGELYRRVNMLTYLNRGWQPDWNGQLELRREPKSTDGRVVIEPVFNRTVIFEASEHSWHGHPPALTCPEGVTRKSAAFYFYSREPHPTYTVDHSTLYIGKPPR